MAAAHVPPGTVFATKPALAGQMIERAIGADVPFSWVAGDTVYGVGEIVTALRRAGKGFVLGVASSHHFDPGETSWRSPAQLKISPKGSAPQPGNGYRPAKEPSVEPSYCSHCWRGGWQLRLSPQRSVGLAKPILDLQTADPHEFPLIVSH
jgi:hypothetical protein